MESSSRPHSRKSSRRETHTTAIREKRESWRDDRLNTITPTSGLDLLIRQALARTTSQNYFFDEDGNPISPPASPLRRSMQPLENITDLMRQKRKSWHDGGGSSESLGSGAGSSADSAPSRLLALPTELQFLVFAYLGLSDLERLRRTCQFYRHILSPEYVRALFGGYQGLASQLIGHCQNCLETPGRGSLILQPNTRPLSSKCFRCSVQARELSIGTNVPLASMGKAWVCRWCGWPVAGSHSWANEQFHINCYDRYYRVLWAFLFLGFAQFSVGIVAAALSLVYFRHELVVFAPTVVNFVLLWVCMVFLMLRGNRIRTYHWVGAVELIIMCLWIPPMYVVARDLEKNSGIRTASITALTFFAVNMLFRLLNCVGNLVLTFEYDMTKHYLPQITLRRRLLNLLMTGLIYWTYPQSVEQRYPPDFN